jgi:hypothetical protein
MGIKYIQPVSQQITINQFSQHKNKMRLTKRVQLDNIAQKFAAMLRNLLRQTFNCHSNTK